MFDTLLSYELWAGTTLGDLLTVEFLTQAAGNVAAAVSIVILGYIASGWAARRVRGLTQSYKRLDATLFNFLSNILRYTILGYTGIFVLNTFGIQTTSFVAIIGAAGLAIGLALQGTLSNIAAGVMIVLFRPFKVEDFVEVAGKMGTVKDISLNFTELADLSNLRVIVPNAQVWGNIITNYSANNTRRAEWIFGVGYASDLKAAEEAIRKAILTDPRALTDPEPFIQVNNLGDFSVDFLVRVWVKADEYFQFQADMKRAVKLAFDEAGIDIPFPTRTVISETTQ